METIFRWFCYSSNKNTVNSFTNHDSYIALKTQHHSKFPNHRHMRFYIFLIIKIIYPLPCIIRYGVNIFHMWKNITLCACVPNNHNRNTDHFFFLQTAKWTSVRLNAFDSVPVWIFPDVSQESFVQEALALPRRILRTTSNHRVGNEEVAGLRNVAVFSGNIPRAAQYLWM